MSCRLNLAAYRMLAHTTADADADLIRASMSWTSIGGASWARPGCLDMTMVARDPQELLGYIIDSSDELDVEPGNLVMFEIAYVQRKHRRCACLARFQTDVTAAYVTQEQLMWRDLSRLRCTHAGAVIARVSEVMAEWCTPTSTWMWRRVLEGRERLATLHEMEMWYLDRVHQLVEVCALMRTNTGEVELDEDSDDADQLSDVTMPFDVQEQP